MRVNLIDHSGLHSLRPRIITPAQIPAATLQLLHFVEHVLLADKLVLAGAESDAVTVETERILRVCAKNGLADGATGSMILLPVDAALHRKACHLAAPDVLDYVRAAQKAGVFGAADHDAYYQLQPTGSAKPDFNSLLAIEPHSSAAEDWLHHAFATRGWEATAAPILLNRGLHDWVRQHAALLATDVRARTDLRTILRWQINTQLAGVASDSSAAVASSYWPALGRIVQLQRLCAPLQKEGLNRLLSAVAASQPELDPFRRELATQLRLESTANLPAIGLWFFEAVPVDCSFEKFLSLLVDAREYQTTRALRRWVAQPDAPDSELRVIEEELVGRAKETTHKTRLSGIKTELTVAPGVFFTSLLLHADLKAAVVTALASSLSIKSTVQLQQVVRSVMRHGLVERGSTIMTSIAGRREFGDTRFLARLEATTASILAPSRSSNALQ